jgi:hypothetical protein
MLADIVSDKPQKCGFLQNRMEIGNSKVCNWNNVSMCELIHRITVEMFHSLQTENNWLGYNRKDEWNETVQSIFLSIYV